MTERVGNECKKGADVLLPFRLYNTHEYYGIEIL